MRLKKLLLGSFAACLLSACTAEYLPDIADGGESDFIFTLNTGVTLSASTRVTDESTLSDVWVVQLNKAGTAALIAPSHVKPDGANKIKVKLEKTDSKVYFFANTGDANLFDPDAALSTFTTATVEAASMTYNSDWGEKSYIPMFGTWEGTPTVPTISDKVELTRAFAILKIKVSRVQPAAANFGFTSLQLKNVPNVLRLCPSTEATYPAATGTYINYPINTDSSPMYDYPTYTFYVPENHRGTGSERFETEKNGTLVANGGYATYYEIKGKYAGVSTVYRFYLGGNNTNNYNIDRNCIYTVNITLAGPNQLDARVEMDNAPLTTLPGTDVNWGGGGSSDLNASGDY